MSNYKNSLPRQEFENTIAHYLALLQKINSNIAIYDSNIMQCVLTTSIFQTSASFENYLKDIISGWFFNIKSQHPKKTKYPDEIKATVLLKRQKEIYKRYIFQNKEVDTISEIIGKLGFIDDVSTGNYIFSLHENEIVDDKKYPSIANIRILFNRIGLTSIFNAIGKKGKYDAIPILTSLMDIRTEIAHTSYKTALNIVDIETILKNMIRVVSTIDEVMYDHVIVCTNKKCWVC